MLPPSPPPPARNACILLWEQMRNLMSCFAGSVWFDDSPKKSRACLCHKNAKYVLLGFLAPQKILCLLQIISAMFCWATHFVCIALQHYTPAHLVFWLRKLPLLELHDLKYMNRRRRCVNSLIILNRYLTFWPLSILTDKMVKQTNFSKCKQKE